MINAYISATERKKLSRAIHSMPAEVRQALRNGKLEHAYRARPAYQKNDYIGWIHSAKRPETKEKRLKQMLTELRGGTRYMGMKYSPSE